MSTAKKSTSLELPHRFYREKPILGSLLKVLGKLSLIRVFILNLLEKLLVLAFLCMTG